MAITESTGSSSKAYSEDYIEQVFLTWYKSGRPKNMKDFQEALFPSEDGRVPSTHVLSRWRNRYSWDDRSRVLDVKAKDLVDTRLVNDKAEMLQRQADYGKMLQRLGAEYFEDGDVNSATVALSMITKGAELERSAIGLPEALMQVSNKSDESLLKTVFDLLSKAGISSIEFGEVVEGRTLEITEVIQEKTDDREENQ